MKFVRGKSTSALGHGRSLRGRPSTRALALALGLFAMAMLPHHANGQALVWAPGGDSANPGGSGIWDATSPSWWNGTFMVPWNNATGYSAYFGGSAGTVTVDAGGVDIQDITFATSGYVIDGGPLTMTTGTPSLITTIAGGTDTINSAITGASALGIDGGGTLVLGGVNTYTDGTTILGNSTLQISSDDNLGAAGGSLTFGDAMGTAGGILAITDPGTGIFASARSVKINAGGAVLDVASGVTASFSGAFDGTGVLTKINGGTLVLTGDNTYSGATIISEGTLQVGDGGTSGSLGSGNVTNNGMLTFNRSDNFNFSDGIAGSGSVTQAGSGTLILSGDNTYTGDTVVSTGTLQIGDDGASGAIAGNIVNNSILAFKRNNTYTYNGVISGTGSVQQNGSGTTVLGGVNTYSGGTYFNSGTLRAASDDSLGDASGALIFNGGWLQASSSFSTSRDVILNGFGGFNSTGGSATLTIDGVVSGTGSFNVNTGTVALTNAANTYSGGTVISGGTLLISDDGNLGAITGTIKFTGGGYLQTTTDLTTARDIIMSSAGNITAANNSVLTLDGAISGSASLYLRGSGATVIANGVNTNSGGFNLQSGVTLQVASAANLGTGALVLGNGTVATTASFTASNNVTLNSGGAYFNVAGGTTFTLSGVVSGSGSSLSKDNTGTLVLTGNNTYSNTTYINAGTLQIGNGGTTGNLSANNVYNNGALVFNRSNSYSFANAISGSGSLQQLGAGTTVLSGNNSYTGATTVLAGALYVDGNQSAATGLTSVAAGATLGGSGIIGGSVVIADGGILAPGDAGAPGSLTINGDLSLSNGSVLNYRFGQSDTAGGVLNDMTTVNGNLTLDGTINVSVPTGGSFDPGVYRVFNYGGTLTDNGLALGSMPAGSNVTVQTSVTGQVNLVNTAMDLTFWDGGNGSKFNNGIVDGGTGVWNSGAGSNSNWTDLNGAANTPYTDGTFAVFEGASGTVTVDNSLGQVVSAGMQFAVDGYRVTGDPITLVERAGMSTNTTTIRVGDGTAAGAGYTATIASVLQGSTTLTKRDLGTLVLTGENTYNGGTSIVGGTLQLGDGGASGSIVGDVVDNALLAFNRSDAHVFDGAISGTGAVTQIGPGRTILTGSNTYTGGTTISAGVLQIGNGGASGTITGDVANNAVLAFDRNDTYTYDGVISGSGALEQIGTGKTILTGNNTYTGGTVISAGTLQLGNGNSSGNGSIVGNVIDNGNLAFNRTDSYTFGGAISGTGMVTLNSGTLTLSGNNSYSGGTTVNNGTLNFSSDANLGDSSGGITLNYGMINATANITTSRDITVNWINAATGFSTSNGATLTLDGVISGAGALNIRGGGTRVVINNSANSYTGGTIINSARVALSSDVNLGAANGGINFYNGGTLEATSSFTTDRSMNFTLYGGGIQVNNGVTLTANGAMTGYDGNGSGSLTKTGAGTLILTANGNNYRDTNINQGVVQIGNGGTSGSLGFGKVNNNGTLVFDRSDAYAYDGVISGAGSVQQIGSGTTVLTGTSTYSGGTSILAGTLQLGNGGTSGSIAGNVANFGALAFDRSDDITFGNVISGSGSVHQIGSGTLTLSGANTYSGGTVINNGTVQISSDANLGDAAGPLSFDAGALLTTADITMGRATTIGSGGATFEVASGTMLTMNGPIDGAGGLTKTDLGTLVLTGDNSYAGSTTVSAGKLYIDGDQSAATGATDIESGALLGGTGTIGGDVTVADGATLAPGAPDGTGGTLTVNGNLTTGVASNLDYQFGQVGGAAVNSSIDVNGDLTVGGRLNVSVPAGGTFDPGVYRVFSYSGTLTNNGLALGTVPAGTTLTLQTRLPHQINLVNTTGQVIVFWDGNNQADFGDGLIQGGSGVWNTLVGANNGWTDPVGGVNSHYQNNAFAVFQGAPGTVTVDATGGEVVSSGMQFASDGYTINGDAIMMVDTSSQATTGSTTIRVGDGTAEGASFSAAIGAILEGETQLVKTDMGRLILSGANTYLGGTAISGGILQIANDGNLGDAAGGLSFNGGTLAVSSGLAMTRAVTLNSNGGSLDVMNASDTLTMSGLIDGVGGLIKTGAGTLVITNANTYTGGTAINDGVLQIANDANLGDAAGVLSFDGGTLVTTTSFAMARATTLESGGGTFDVASGTVLTQSGDIDGAGGLTKTNDGTLVLAGANTYTGNTVISGGTVQVGDGGSAGSLVSDVINNSLLVFNRSDAYAYGGMISGSGAVQHNGSGTLTLSGISTYSGGTTISAGTVVTTNGSALGSGLVTIDAAAGLNLNFASAETFANQLAGTGTTSVTGALATITGANAGFGGNWQIAGQAAIDGSASDSLTNLGTGTVNIASGGVLHADTTGAFTFNNALTGNGTLSASNNGHAFLFGAGAGSAFTGTVALSDNSFNLSGSNTNTLTNATLSLGSGNVTTIGDGTQTIGGLAFNGGKLVFNVTIPDESQATSYLEVSGAGRRLDLSGTGTVQITLPASMDMPVQPMPGSTGILAQDDGGTVSKLAGVANGATVIGGAGGLTIVDQNGNPIDSASAQATEIMQNGMHVADGTYSYRLNTGTSGDGLYVAYALSELNLIGTGANALVLMPEAGATGVASDLSAKLTGSGDLSIMAGAGDTVTLSNATNTYTGATFVGSGTLRMAADNVLGQSSALNVATGAAFDMAGYSAQIGALNTQAGSLITVTSGSILTITDAQRAAGDTNGGALDNNTLAGGGTLVIDPSILHVNGTQAGFTGSVEVTGGSTLIVNTANVYDNAQGVHLATAGDSLIFGDLSSFNSGWTGAPTGASAMTISGFGSVMVQDGANVSLTGNNAAFAGAFTIAAQSTLHASMAQNLGTASIRADGTFAIDSSSDWQLANLVTGTGAVVKTGSGTLTIDQALANFTGLTDIQGGTLAFDDHSATGSAIGGSVNVAAGATLSGSGVIDGVLTNSGTVNVAGTVVGNLLTVGGIIGHGGTFVLNTVLGRDDSATDRIVINGGTVTGPNLLRIVNQGGMGDWTDVGIMVVQAINGATTALDAFTLDPMSSGYRSTDGTLAIGAFDYSLVRGGSGGDVNSWYLSSGDTGNAGSGQPPSQGTSPDGVPSGGGKLSKGGGSRGSWENASAAGRGTRIMRPEAGIYDTNADVARTMFFTTLHDREGSAQSTGADHLYSGWGHINGRRQSGRAGGNALGTRAGTVSAQLGLDLLHYNSPKLGSFYAGVMGGWGHSETDAKSRQRSRSEASGAVDGYSVGAYGTWYQKDRGQGGAYIDTWAQYSWFDNRVHGGGLPQEKYKSHAFTASVETGYAFLLMNNGKNKLFIEPEAQIAYVSYDMGHHVEQGGTHVRMKDGHGFTGRVGARLRGEFDLKNGVKVKPFIEANYWRNQKGGKLLMNNDLVRSGAPRSYTEIKAGFATELSKNLEISAQASTQVGGKHYKSFGGQIGLKYTW